MHASAETTSASHHAAIMVENLTTGALLLDAEWRLVAMNPAAEALLDLSAKRVRGLPAGRLFAGTRIEGRALCELLAEGLPFTQRELSLHLPGERSLLVDCTVTPLAEPAEPAGALVELVPAERGRRLEREEHLVSQSARSLLRSLAHEIRNPLGGLRGAAQLLHRELADPSLREYTRIVMDEADRLRSLLDRMLGPRTPPRLQAVNVHEVTERVRALLEAEAPPGVTMERDYDPSVPALHADAELLIQAVLNVARNAVQALDGEGRVTLRTRVERQITIGRSRHRLAVRVDVEDDGPGVPESVRDTLFYPLVSARPEGSGLGLSIAQSLVMQHGGIIECDSRPGHTVFGILLPVEEAT